MPKVYNHKHADVPYGAVDISRPSSYGNPFVFKDSKSMNVVQVPDRETAVTSYAMLMQCKTSEEIIEKFDVDFMLAHVLAAQAEWIRDHLPELKGKDLVCWCAPLSCHGDVLLHFANKE